MRYRVRTPEGELEYPSLREVEQAYAAGLVAPEDEVLEEGGTLWRKAGSLPTLAQAQRRHRGARPSSASQGLIILIAAVLGVFALLLVRSGRGVFGLLIAIAIASLLFRVTAHAFRRKR
ncbi:MAG: hypothetical protein JXB05_31935 [Myxococcaceae bacterium]|nr:hypothetical protein [Myxococcaceae bacterium]